MLPRSLGLLPRWERTIEKVWRGYEGDIDLLQGSLFCCERGIISHFVW